jgi:pimeloyl-ACP methyl ester carboxylesterase
MKPPRLRRFFDILVAIFLVAAAWQWTVTRLDAWRFPPPGRLVDIGGRKLHLLCSGAGSPTVILEPSGLGAVVQYEKVQGELSRDMRVCAYDRAGQGWSDASPEPADARHLAADLSALLARSGEPPPYLFVASSAGGLTVELFAREHPDQVAGLLMLDALNRSILRGIPEVQGLWKSACAARYASWFGLPRIFDPLGLRRLPPAERDRAIALTYKTSTLTTACSLTRSFEASADQLLEAPPIQNKLPIIVLMHDDPTGILPGLDPARSAELELLWRTGQHSLAAPGNAYVVHSRHLIASDNPAVVIQAARRLRDTYRAAGSA